MRFKVPTPYMELKIGDIVTFSFDNYTQKAPVNPTIIRHRRDLTWQDVLYSYRSASDVQRKSKARIFFLQPFLSCLCLSIPLEVPYFFFRF